MYKKVENFSTIASIYKKTIPGTSLLFSKQQNVFEQDKEESDETRKFNEIKILLWWKRIFRNEIRSSTIKNFFSDKNLNTSQRAPDKNISWLWTISFGKVEQKCNDRANYRSVSASGSYWNRNQISDFQGLIKFDKTCYGAISVWLFPRKIYIFWLRNKLWPQLFCKSIEVKRMEGFITTDNRY